VAAVRELPDQNGSGLGLLEAVVIFVGEGNLCRGRFAVGEKYSFQPANANSGKHQKPDPVGSSIKMASLGRMGKKKSSGHQRRSKALVDSGWP